MTLKKFLLAILVLFLIQLEPLLTNNQIPNLLKKLKNDHENVCRDAIVEFHNLGKESIPVLIDEIGDGHKRMLSLADPMLSTIRDMSLYLNHGIVAAYVIELILAKPNLTINVPGDYPFLLGTNRENYIYGHGVIVDNNDKVVKEDRLHEVKTIYQKWWKKNKDKSLEELRKDWQANIRPLTGSNFHWE